MRWFATPMIGCRTATTLAYTYGDVLSYGSILSELFPDLLCLMLQGVVGNLASLAIESASTVNPLVVQLQMLAALAEAWALRWPSRPLSFSTVTLPMGLTGSSDGQPVIPGDSDFDRVEDIWRCREDAAGTHLGWECNPAYPVRINKKRD